MSKIVSHLPASQPPATFDLIGLTLEELCALKALVANTLGIRGNPLYVVLDSAVENEARRQNKNADELIEKHVPGLNNILGDAGTW